MEDEFDHIDLDLRDLLDELVDTSLKCISAMQMAQLVLESDITTDEDKIIALQTEHEAYAELEEVSYCYLSTIGYHS